MKTVFFLVTLDTEENPVVLFGEWLESLGAETQDRLPLTAAIVGEGRPDDNDFADLADLVAKGES